MYSQVLLRNRLRGQRARVSAESALPAAEPLPLPSPLPALAPALQPPTPDLAPTPAPPEAPKARFSLTKLGKVADIALVSSLALLLVFVVIWLAVGWGPRKKPAPEPQP
jgi:hypothetical protein